MKYLGIVRVTPHEAREIEMRLKRKKQGYFLKFKHMHMDGTDTYEVCAKDGE